MSAIAPPPSAGTSAAAVQVGTGRVIHWTRSAAALVLGLAAIGVWWPALGAGTLWILPVLLLTAGVAGDAIELPDRRARMVFPWLWLAWTPIALLIAGLPAWTLSPLEFGTTASEMGRALASSLGDAGDEGGPWLLGAWLFTTALFWFLAASSARRASRGSAAAGFFLFAAPFAAALAFGHTQDAAWQGGAILIGGLLWATRGNLRDGLPALAVVAVAGVLVAASIAPTERWSGLDPQNRGKPPFSELETKQTYGPPGDRKTGATVFKIRAERPSLWRMEVLPRFDGRVWSTDADPMLNELPQPAARRTSSTVQIETLGNELAVGPGRIESVTGERVVGPGRRIGTEAVVLIPRPKRGDTYTVISDEVPLTDALASVKVPRGAAYRPFTEVFPRGSGLPNPAVGNFPREASGTGYGQVVALAERLARGTDSQLEIVERVEQHLTTSGLYEYSLDVDEPGPYPLLDFLLVDRVGYCQQFAGAAALLLRLIGIPTRVVAGFATGVPDGPNEWTVRDQEAHAWIEVYFPDHGWVAFNPTPGDAEAQVAAGVGDPQGQDGAASSRSVEGAKVPALIVVGVLAFIGLAFALARLARAPRRDPAALGDVLAGVVPAPAGPSMTFAELRDDLGALGPAVTALVDEAELQRFGPQDRPPERRPRRRVWRALVSDIGVLRAARILLLGPGRRPITDGGGPKVASSAPPPSVAPPGAGGAPA